MANPMYKDEGNKRTSYIVTFGISEKRRGASWSLTIWPPILCINLASIDPNEEVTLTSKPAYFCTTHYKIYMNLAKHCKQGKYGINEETWQPLQNIKKKSAKDYNTAE